MVRARSSTEFPRPYGKYELLERLGDGGMAEVFRARLPGAAGFEKIVAIKRILPHLARRKHIASMFVAEAKLSAEVQHKNIVQVFELGEAEDGEFFMAMEYIKGADLRRLLRSAEAAGLRVPPWFSVHVMIEVLEGLAYVHELTDAEGRPRQVIHRDVSPSNVFISHLGEVKLGDFGVAKDATRESLTETGQLKGKIPYMSPEQLHGQPLDARADVFAAGVVLWECLTQQRLFGAHSELAAMKHICEAPRRAPSDLAPGIPPALDRAVLEAVAVSRDERTPSARELQATLLDVLPDLARSVRTTDVRRVIEGILDVKLRDAAQLRPFSVPRSQGFWGGDTEVEPERPEPATVDGRRGETKTDLDLGLEPVAPTPELLDPRELVELGSPTAPIRPARVQEAQPGAGAKSLSGELELEVVVGQPVLPSVSTSNPRFAKPRGEQVFDLESSAPTELPPEWLMSGAQPHEPEISGRHGGFGPEHGLERAGGYQGPHPFWARDLHGGVHGPFDLEGLVRVVRGQANKTLAGGAVSGDGTHFLPLAAFAELTGQEGLLHDDTVKVVVRDGMTVLYLDERSMVSCLAEVARLGVSGRVVVLPEGLRRTVYRELHLVSGAPTYVYANDEVLQLPEALVQRRAVARSELARLVHAALTRGRPLEDLVVDLTPSPIARGSSPVARGSSPIGRTEGAPGRHRQNLMKDRLGDTLRWHLGRVIVDPLTRPRAGAPFARSLMALIPELVARGMSTDDLRAELGRAVDDKLERTPELEEGLEALGFSPIQREIALRLAKSRRLGAQLRAYAEEEKTILLVAYVLTELGLLVRT